VSVNRLGKGLGALIRPEKEAKKKSVSKRPKRVDEIAKIAISEIRPNPNQPRREFDQSSLQELANSIKEKGVVTPITVRKLDSRYELIAGERRWRASKILNKKTIPAYIIKVKNDAEIMEIALIENIQRKNLNAIEEAEAYEVLNTKYKMTHNQISNAVGKKRVTISNSLRLLKLPIDIRKSLRVGEITIKNDGQLIVSGQLIPSENLVLEINEFTLLPGEEITTWINHGQLESGTYHEGIEIQYNGDKKYVPVTIERRSQDVLDDNIIEEGGYPSDTTNSTDKLMTSVVIFLLLLMGMGLVFSKEIGIKNKKETDN